MIETLNKFKKITNRELLNKTYDYLILDIDDKKEIKILMDFIKESKIKIDVFFFIDAKFRKQKLYLQISDIKEKKKNMINNLKFIHNFWRINFNKNISYKKASKHSVFFDGKNFVLSTLLKKDYVTYKYTNSFIQKKVEIWFEDEYKEL